MSFLSRLLGRRESAGSESGDQQAVIVWLPRHLDEDELTAFEGKLTELITENDLGEFDGHDQGAEETVIYMYGSDAERLFRGIRGLLKSEPCCAYGRLVVRRGGPGAPERQVTIASA